MSAPLLGPAIQLADPRAPVTTATLNAIFALIGNAIDSGTRDPGDSIYGYGGAGGISAWGPSNTIYPTHGPGAGGSDWVSAYAGSAAIPADPNDTQIDPSTALTAAHGIQGHIQKFAGALGQLLQNDPLGATHPWWYNIGSIQLAQLNPGSPQAGQISLASNKSVSAGTFASIVAQGTAPYSATSHTVCPNLNAQYLADEETGAPHQATTEYGTSAFDGMLAVLNSSGLHDSASIAATLAQAAAWVASPAIIDDDLSNIRFLLQEYSSAAQAGGVWSSPPSNLVQSITVTSPWATTVASGSNAVDVSTFAGAGTLYVTSVYNAAPVGSINGATNAGSATFTYTGVDPIAVAFTGVTTVSGSGTLATGNLVQSTGNQSTLAGLVGVNLGEGLVGTVQNGVLTLSSLNLNGVPVTPLNAAYVDRAQTFSGSQTYAASVAYALVTKSSAYTLTAADTYCLVDSTAAAVTITLPTAVGCTGRVYAVKDWKGTGVTHHVTVATTAAQTIDGASTLVISTNYGIGRVISDGANWAAI